MKHICSLLYKKVRHDIVHVYWYGLIIFHTTKHSHFEIESLFPYHNNVTSDYWVIPNKANVEQKIKIYKYTKSDFSIKDLCNFNRGTIYVCECKVWLCLEKSNILNRKWYMY